MNNALHERLVVAALGGLCANSRVAGIGTNPKDVARIARAAVEIALATQREMLYRHQEELLATVKAAQAKS